MEKTVYDSAKIIVKKYKKQYKYTNIHMMSKDELENEILAKESYIRILNMRGPENRKQFEEASITTGTISFKSNSTLDSPKFNAWLGSKTLASKIVENMAMEVKEILKHDVSEKYTDLVLNYNKSSNPPIVSMKDGENYTLVRMGLNDSNVVKDSTSIIDTELMRLQTSKILDDYRYSGSELSKSEYDTQAVNTTQKLRNTKVTFQLTNMSHNKPAHIKKDQNKPEEKVNIERPNLVENKITEDKVIYVSNNPQTKVDHNSVENKLDDGNSLIISIRKLSILKVILTELLNIDLSITTSFYYHTKGTAMLDITRFIGPFRVQFTLMYVLNKIYIDMLKVDLIGKINLTQSSIDHIRQKIINYLGKLNTILSSHEFNINLTITCIMEIDIIKTKLKQSLSEIKPIFNRGYSQGLYGVRIKLYERPMFIWEAPHALKYNPYRHKYNSEDDSFGSADTDDSGY